MTIKRSFAVLESREFNSGIKLFISTIFMVEDKYLSINREWVAEDMAKGLGMLNKDWVVMNPADCPLDPTKAVERSEVPVPPKRTIKWSWNATGAYKTSTP